MRFHVYYTLVQLAGKTEQTSAIFTNVVKNRSNIVVVAVVAGPRAAQYSALAPSHVASTST